MSDLLDLCAPNATWRDGPCAEVRVGDHVIRYVRRGSGSSVVLLGADSNANPLWKPLIEALAANHRIVVPQLPPTQADVGSWLHGFVEGIGLSSIVLIAGAPWTEPALELAAEDDVTIRKLILIPTTDSALPASPPSLAESIAGRTLWVATDSDVEPLARIQQFIS